MSVLCLKIIALTTMIIDHYGAIFKGDMMAYRMIGRIAFPIYCFLLIEGYYHTKDVKKYMLRLFVFALLSEIPFDLAFFGRAIFSHQNIFFTLCIGLFTIYNIEKLKDKNKIMSACIIIISFIASDILNVDYQIIGIIYILSFYYTRNMQKLQRLCLIAATMYITNLLSSSVIQQFSLFSLLILFFYNEELGPSSKVLQILFYASYPAHLIIFYLINTF